MFGSVLTPSQAHRSSMDMVLPDHRGWELRAFRMPVSPDAHLDHPLVILTGRTLRPLDTRKGRCQRSERQTTQEPDQS